MVFTMRWRASGRASGINQTDDVSRSQPSCEYPLDFLLTWVVGVDRESGGGTFSTRIVRGALVVPAAEFAVHACAERRIDKVRPSALL